MIRVLSITVYKATTSRKILYESFRDKQFTGHDDIRDWVRYLEIQWEAIKGFSCRVYPVIRSKPPKELNMMDVLAHTAHVMGQPFDEVIANSRKRKYVDVRQAACMILLELDYNPMDIERELPFKNRAVYDYRTKMENRIAVEKGFEDRYNKIRDKVKALTVGLNNNTKLI